MERGGTAGGPNSTTKSGSIFTIDNSLSQVGETLKKNKQDFMDSERKKHLNQI